MGVYVYGLSGDYKTASHNGAKALIQPGNLASKRIQGFCASCRQPISKENFRGTVHETFRGMHRVEAVGRCGNCRMVTCFRWDIKEDGISGRDQSGNWTTWRAEAKKGPAAWFRKLLRL
jgi:hypothetical protein